MHPSRSFLIIGRRGQLSRSVQKIAHEFPQFSFEFVGREQLDLGCANSIAEFFASSRSTYSALLNTAAYTAVDNAEREPELAYQINHLAVQQLAEIAKEQGMFFMQVSTDYVFSNPPISLPTTGWCETDLPAPLNVYGHSKWLAEQALQASGCQGAVIRTSWLFSEFDSNFVRTMLRLAAQQPASKPIKVVNDQIGTPTYATDLARAMLHLLSQQLDDSVLEKPHRPVEIYHFSNQGQCSWYELAVEIFQQSTLKTSKNIQVQPIASRDYPTLAQRPTFSALDSGKVQRTLNLPIAPWQNALKRCLSALESP